MKRFRVQGEMAWAIFAALVLLAVRPLSTFAADQPTRAVQLQAPSSGGCSYAVRYGDTLWGVALRYGVSPQYMAMMNGGSVYRNLYPGMQMRVPCKTRYRPMYPQPAYGGSYANICAYYLVRPGDNLFRIGLRYGMSWQPLAVANRLYNPNYIYSGMRLAIPCSTGYRPGYRSDYSPPKPRPSQPVAQPTSPAGGGTVVMQNISFNPTTITIRTGQRVTWRNGEAPASGIPHTSTSDTGVWSSPVLNPGGAFSFTFNSPGTYNYHCTIHPDMRGTVIVTQ